MVINVEVCIYNKWEFSGDFERIALVFWDNPKIAINEYLSPDLKKKPLEQVLTTLLACLLGISL